MVTTHGRTVLAHPCAGYMAAPAKITYQVSGHEFSGMHLTMCGIARPAELSASTAPES